MSNDKYNLEERTAKFGENIIRFCRKIRVDEVTRPIISQLIRSGTSTGSNYCEADDAESRSDFKHKIGIVKKEARETKHWLRMVLTAAPYLENETKTLWQEAKELHLIFNAVINSTKRNNH